MKGWLYCDDEPEGKVFEGKAYDLAKQDGWVDTPSLLGKEEPEPVRRGRPKKG